MHDSYLAEQQKLLQDIKNDAFLYYSNGNLDSSIQAIRAYAIIASNINAFYTDSELEQLLCDIAVNLRISSMAETRVNQSKKIVFYDGFGLSNVPLSLQYIRALIANNCEFLYLYEDNKGKIDHEISKELSGYPLATVNKIATNLSPIQRIKEGYDIINSYNPSLAILHLGEVHVEAISIFSLFPSIIKFRINLGDHQFWLGANQLDYSLEFRNYGATISLEKRGIPASKLLYQPYYPIVDDRKFEGFPFEFKDGNVILFSGGRLFKIFGRNYEFFSIVKKLLDDNEKLIFVLAGKNGGDLSFINDFIKKNRFESRFYYIGHRRDVNEVFKHSDLFLNTYPQSGGLMCLYAAVHNKPILTFTTDDLPENSTESLLYLYNSNKKITYTDRNEFFRYASLLINNELVRNEVGQEISQFVVSKSAFDEMLQKNLDHCECFRFDRVEIDYHALVKMNIEMEYDFYNMTSYALITCYGWKLFYKYPAFSFKIAKFVISWLKKR